MLDTQRMVHFRAQRGCVLLQLFSWKSFRVLPRCAAWRASVEPALRRQYRNSWSPKLRTRITGLDMLTVAVWYVSKGLLYCCIGEVRFKLSTPNFVTFQPVRKTRFTCRKTLSHIPHQSTDTLTCTAPVLLHCLIATD